MALDVLANVVAHLHAVGAVYHHTAIGRIPDAAVLDDVAGRITQCLPGCVVAEHVPVEGITRRDAGLPHAAELHPVDSDA